MKFVFLRLVGIVFEEDVVFLVEHPSDDLDFGFLQTVRTVDSHT